MIKNSEILKFEFNITFHSNTQRKKNHLKLKENCLNLITVFILLIAFYKNYFLY